MATSNKLLHELLPQVVKPKLAHIKNGFLDKELSDRALWVGGSLTYLALRSTPPGVPILGHNTLRYIARHFPGDDNLPNYYLEAIKADTELTQVIDAVLEEAEPLGESTGQLIKVSAGCVRFYLDQEYQQNLAAQWN